MKNETPRIFYILLIGLAFISGFIYFNWDNFIDLTNNSRNFLESHPGQMIPFDKFLSYIENGDIKKVDL